MRAAAMVLLMACADSHTAPSPKPKPPVIPAVLQGGHIMLWCGSEGETHFHAGGHFACHWNGTWWEGRWHCEKGVLHVEEWVRGGTGVAIRWEAKLTSPVAGVCQGSPWRLRPLPPGKEL